ncbi:MAG: nucleoside triphosphate pyrophosphatase [Pseudomonadota bacterium]
MKITLASNSQIRKQLMTSAGVSFDAVSSSFDEDALKRRLLSENESSEAISLALAKGKAEAVAKKTDGLVIGCDQVLNFKGNLLSKPTDLEHARAQLKNLRNQDHQLLSAVAIYEGPDCIWSHVGVVTLTMHDFSDSYLEEYLQRNWNSIRSSVGGYKLEEEGVRLFSKIDGDYFTVLGMPLMEVLKVLAQRGTIRS